MPMSNQAEKIKMLNQAVSDLQAQIIAKDKQIAFLQGQIYNYKWIIKNANGMEGYDWNNGYGDNPDDEDEYGDHYCDT